MNDLRFIMVFIQPFGTDLGLLYNTRLCPPVMSWFIHHRKFRYVSHQPYLLELLAPTSLTMEHHLVFIPFGTPGRDVSLGMIV